MKLNNTDRIYEVSYKMNGASAIKTDRFKNNEKYEKLFHYLTDSCFVIKGFYDKHNIKSVDILVIPINNIMWIEHKDTSTKEHL